MKKTLIGIIIAVVVVGGGYIVYNRVSQDSPNVKQVALPVIHTTKDTKTTQDKDGGTVKQVNVSSPTTEVSNKKQPDTSTSNVTQVNSVNTSKQVAQVNTDNSKPTASVNNSDSSASSTKSAPQPKNTVQVKSDSSTKTNTDGVMSLANTELYNSNPKYKKAVTGMYNYLKSNGLENNAYMISLCKNPEQNKNVQTEGLMGMISLKVTKNQEIIQQIVNDYGWIQVSVGGM